MSNTDGEDTLRIEKEAIAFADSIEVNSIATHTGLVKGYIAGAKELASLREQLAKKDEDAIQAIDALTKQIAELMHQLKQKDLEAKYWLTQSKTLQSDLKQKEDENRELVNFLLAIPIDPVYWVEYDSLIRKHKNNLSA